MALTINERKEPTMAKVTVDRRLWLTADGEKLVEDGSPKAAFLWAIAGREVSKDEADRVGYKPKTKAKPQPKAKSAPEPKPKAEAKASGKSSPKDDTSGKDED